MKSARWMARVGVVIGVGVIIHASPAFGQGCPDQIDSIGGFSRLMTPTGMEVSGSLAYVVHNWCSRYCYSNLSVLDVSDPKGPRIVSQVGECQRDGCNYYVTHVGASDDRLFTLERGARTIDYLDVSEPSNPVLITGYYRFDEGAGETALYGIEVLGDLVYVTSSDGLKILDVSEIDNPTEVGFHESTWEPSAFAVSAGYAYVFEAGTGLRIIDVSDPAQTIEVGYWPATSQVYEVEVSGDLAFVAANDDGLRIISVADPENPIELSVFETSEAVGDVSVEGSVASVAMGSDGVSIIDVSNPSTPREIGRYSTDLSALNVVLDGTTMYLLVIGDYWAYGTEGGIRVVDVSTPHHSVEYSSVDFVREIMDVVVTENTMYTANGDLGVSVGNLEGRSHWLDTPGFARGVTPYGQYILVADDHKGLRIIDTADPSRLEEVGFVDTPGQAQRIVVAGDHAYIADGDGGLRIIDLSSPTSPEEVGSIAIPGRATDVAISGDWAYVSDGPGGFHVIDVSDPTQPIETNDIWRGGFLAVAGQLLVAAGGGLQLHNISDPASPSNIHEQGNLPGEATDLAVVGPHAFVSTRSDDRGRGGGVTVFDISLPSNPIRKIGTWEYSGGAVGLTVSNGRVYVATAEAQVPVLDTSCLTTYWVELVANESGFGGSQWRSDVLIKQHPEGWYGQSRFDLSVEFVLHTRDGLFTAEASIPPWSTGVFEDIVGLLGYEGKGALEIRAETPIWVSSRAYSLTDSGTTGAYVPGYRSSECLRQDQRAHLLGLRQEEGKYRTNISVTNIGEEGLWVRIYLLQADGTELGSFAFWVEPGMTVQEIQPFKNRVNRPNIGWGSALVWTPEGRILTSATVIDSRTNDAVFVPMTPVPEWTYMVK